jgi:hypothetical protein
MQGGVCYTPANTIDTSRVLQDAHPASRLVAIIRVAIIRVVVVRRPADEARREWVVHAVVLAVVVNRPLATTAAAAVVVVGGGGGGAARSLFAVGDLRSERFPVVFTKPSIPY